MSEFVIASCEPTKLVEAVEESLNEVVRFVSIPIKFARSEAIAARRDDGLGAHCGDDFDKGIAVASLIRNYGAGGKGLDQRGALGDDGNLSAGENQPQRIAKGIDASVDFGYQSAARPTDRLIATVFLGRLRHVGGLAPPLNR